ncbi:MAG: hypothetical protein Q4G46_02515 [Propionibacteriaceae bacterium]|nr:hypothetical protein [Propionibacteriaceae bacterium]
MSSIVDPAAISLLSAPESEAEIDLVAARWTHPALAGRTLVRLVPEPLLDAEQLSLEVLGVSPGERTRVGRVRRRAVGFPAWPMIHDPANARHALNLVVDLERAGAVARSKPKAARDRIDALVARLDGSAPHFVPTLLEEAGRQFLRVENPKMAAQLFSRAREWERRHDIPVDPERHQDVFLEFAYAGALPVKELTAEASRLAKQPDKAAAYRAFRTLCVERVRGGLEPNATMAKDLRRLAKAAKLDVAAEDAAVVRDLLSAPSIGRATKEFWTAYDAAIGRIASEPRTRARLRQLAPRTISVDDWVGALQRWGVLDDLIATGDTGWFRRMVGTAIELRDRQFYSPRLGELASVFAPMLVAEEPIVLDPRHIALVSADLIDLLLELGVTVTISPTPLGTPERTMSPTGVPLVQWAKQDQRRDLTALCASEEFAEAVQEGFSQALRWRMAVLDKIAPLLARHRGTRELVIARLSDAARSTGVRPLSIATLNAAWTSVQPWDGLEDDPEITGWVEAVRAQFDPVTLTADNLRLGLAAELAWPAATDALQTSRAATPAQQHYRVRSAMCWPTLVMVDTNGVQMIDDEGTRAVVHPTGESITGVVRVGEELALQTYDRAKNRFVYAWDRDPATVRTRAHAQLTGPNLSTHVSLEVPGGRLFASGIMRPGEDDPWAGAQNGTVLHDGETYWSATATECHELDPTTGRRHRASLPDWLAEQQRRFPDHTLVPGECQLHPMTPGTAGSWVSSANGFHRIAVLTRKQGDATETVLVDAVDTVYRCTSSKRFRPRLVVARPGGGRWLVSESVLFDAGSGQELSGTARNGPGPTLPLTAWHYLQPVSEQASQALRAVTPRQAEPLVRAVLEAQSTEQQTKPAGGLMGALRSLTKAGDPLDVAARLVGPGPLAKAVVDLVTEIIDRCRRAQPTVARPAAAVDPVRTHGGFLGDLAEYRAGTTVESVRNAGVLLGLNRGEQHVGVHWGPWALYVGREAAILALAAMPGRTPSEVHAAAAYWAAYRDAGFLAANPSLSRIALPATEQKPQELISRGILLHRDFVVRADGATGAVTVGGEVHPLVAVHPPAGPRGDLTPAFEALATAVAEQPRTYDPQWGERLAELAGLPLPDAHFLAAGLPGVSGRWSERSQAPSGLGLTGDQITATKQRLARHRHLWLGMLAAGVPLDEPTRIVRDGPDVAAMAAYWRAHTAQDSQRTVPPELLAIQPSWIDTDAAGALLAPTHDPGRTDWAATVPALLWLAEELPADSPLRTSLAESVAALERDFWTERTPVPVGVAGGVRKLWGLPERADQGTTDLAVGPFRLTPFDVLSVVPAELSGPDDPQVAVLGELSLTAFRPTPIWWITRGGLASFGAGVRPRERVAGIGTAVQDPRAVVPELVTDVSAELAVSADAAAYYLQLLALAAPTDRNVQDWNDWTPRRRTKAADELVDKELLVTGKRARAGRSVFLPGGWLEMAAPDLPIEEWKATAFALVEQSPRQWAPRLRGTPALAPTSDLFTTAWRRCTDGDGPGWQELTTTRRRR